MTDTKKTTKAAADTAAEATQTATAAMSGATSALTEAATAYFTGISAISKSVFGVGKEIAEETVEHGKSSMQANCVRSLAEMQAGYVQHRIESATVHAKEVSDVASESFKNVYTPLISMLKERKAA